MSVCPLIGAAFSYHDVNIQKTPRLRGCAVHSVTDEDWTTFIS